MHLYKRLGLWELAERLLQRIDPVRGAEIEERSTSSAWRLLGHVLATCSTLAEVRDRLREHLDRLSDGDNGRLPQQTR